MKNLKITLLALAIGLLSSAGAIGQPLSQHDPVDGPIGIESLYQSAVAPLLIADAGALANEQAVDADALAVPAGDKFSDARRDAIYEAAKNHCGTYPVATQARCLVQMKTSFGRL